MFGVIEWIFEKVLVLIILVLILWGAYIVLSNGAYYGALAGDLLHGLVDGVTSFAQHATG